jgi:hypothetical protein
MRRPILLALLLLGGLHGAVLAGGEKSDSKVKATATATKPDADGKQTVTITLAIEKGFHLLANPVNNELFEGNELSVKITAKEKIKVDVKYPIGKKKKERQYEWDIYEGTVKVEAQVVRTKDDVSPLVVNVWVRAFDARGCLLPATIKLTVP